MQDGTAVPHLSGNSQFNKDRKTPSPTLCKIFESWQLLLKATPTVLSANGGKWTEPFRYDLVNLGREILAQLTVPMVQNFTDATNAKIIDSSKVQETGDLYIALLQDIDALVQTDSAFLLGPWIAMARSLASNGEEDCGEKDCAAFYEWNARVQITTWNPTPVNAKSIPAGPIDYAGKHWSGLIRDYYAVRATLLQKQALVDSQNHNPLNATVVKLNEALLAYNWTNALDKYTEKPVGDALEISQAMLDKYEPYYRSCSDSTNS